MGTWRRGDATPELWGLEGQPLGLEQRKVAKCLVIVTTMGPLGVVNHLLPKGPNHGLVIVTTRGRSPLGVVNHLLPKGPTTHGLVIVTTRGERVPWVPSITSYWPKGLSSPHQRPRHRNHKGAGFLGRCQSPLAQGIPSHQRPRHRNHKARSIALKTVHRRVLLSAEEPGAG